jgi:myo-inositol 2-dehydrogenase/D-chiro-inositol 1-dehydrogenase
MGARHARVVAMNPLVTELVIADADESRAREVAGMLQDETAKVTAASKVDELFGAGLDALVIATPTPTHAPLILRAADEKLAVLCEKPVTLDLAGNDRVIEAVESTGTYLQVGFNRRFDPGFVRCADLVAKGSIGRLFLTQMCTRDPQPPPAEYLAVSGGVFCDMHIHDFDAIRFVTGQEVVEVYADGAALQGAGVEEFDDVDTTALVLRMTDQSLAVISGSRTNLRGYDVRCEVHGTRDSVATGMGGRMPLGHADGTASHRPYTGFLDRFAEAYQLEVAAFLGNVHDGLASPCTGADARAALEIALAANRARRERRPVTLAEIAADLSRGSTGEAAA